MATLYFKKKPSAKNLANRSLSFRNEEIAVVRPGDRLHIEVITGPGLPEINITVDGDKFLAGSVKRKKGDDTFNVYKF